MVQILKGTILYTPAPQTLECHPDSYLVAEEGRVTGIYPTLPAQYKGLPVQDYGTQMIIPGLYDLHVHAPQFAYRGLGLDMQLMQWLDTYAFPTESKFGQQDYARGVYTAFTRALKAAGTVRASVFGTQHPAASTLLMELFHQEGLGGRIGKVNMDTLCPDFYRETTGQSLADTEAWLRDTASRWPRVKPVITPRFIPTCTSELLDGLGKLAAATQTPVQSHMSEDLEEISIVQARYPDKASDAHVYDQFGLLGPNTVMAHFVHPIQEELELVKQRQVVIAHCPQSNCNVAAGLPPIRRMMNMGIRIGLGSDIAGGHSVSIFRAMGEAVMVSKLKWLESGKREDFLSVTEAFYLGTKGGGSYFGKMGSFETGYELDALVLDDSLLALPNEELTPQERLARFIHISDDRHITARYVSGECIG